MNPRIAGETFAQTSNEEAQSTETIKTLTAKVKVKGVTCATDIKTLTTNIEKLDGVTACIPGKHRPSTSFEIMYDPSLISEEEIHAAIEITAGCKNPDDRPYQIK
jgi:copper chaperone CopZ